MTKYLPSVVPVVVALLTAITPTIQDWFTKHPTIGIATAAVYAVVAHWLPSPTAKTGDE